MGACILVIYSDMTVKNNSTKLNVSVCDCLCGVKQACFVASVLLSSVNVIQLEMKGSDGVLWVSVAQKMKSGSGQLDSVRGNKILRINFDILFQIRFIQEVFVSIARPCNSAEMNN